MLVVKCQILDAAIFSIMVVRIAVQLHTIQIVVPISTHNILVLIVSQCSIIVVATHIALIRLTVKSIEV